MLRFELNAQRSVVPEAVDPAVDLARGKDEPPPLAQRDQLVHIVQHVVTFPAAGQVRPAVIVGYSLLKPPRFVTAHAPASRPKADGQPGRGLEINCQADTLQVPSASAQAEKGRECPLLQEPLDIVPLANRHECFVVAKETSRRLAPRCWRSGSASAPASKLSSRLMCPSVPAQIDVHRTLVIFLEELDGDFVGGCS